MNALLANFTSYKLLEACREPGCPVCWLEQRGVERYLDNQFYENVNSSAWRSQLRASHGFCHQHAWLGVEKRLGDALGFSIIYHDIVRSLLDSMHDDANSKHHRVRRASVPGRATGSLRKRIEKILAALTPRKRCPACEYIDGITRDTLSALVKDLETDELIQALRASEGLCLNHLRLALRYTEQGPVSELLLTIHRAKLERLKNELEEFIRKSDYQLIQQGFGSEGDAWLRAIRMVAGSRK
jgi:hypothetical protein